MMFDNLLEEILVPKEWKRADDMPVLKEGNKGKHNESQAKITDKIGL